MSARLFPIKSFAISPWQQNAYANQASGSEMMKNKDDVAAIMRQKQAAGIYFLAALFPYLPFLLLYF